MPFRPLAQSGYDTAALARAHGSNGRAATGADPYPFRPGHDGDGRLANTTGRGQLPGVARVEKIRRTRPAGSLAVDQRLETISFGLRHGEDAVVDQNQRA